MSKLSDAVKALINAPAARPSFTPATARVRPALTHLASDAAERRVGLPAWVTLSVRRRRAASAERQTGPDMLARV